MSKILVMLGSYFPKPSPNGICIKEVVNELRQRGIDVTILATNPGSLSMVETIEGVNVYRVRARWVTRINEWCDVKKDIRCAGALRQIALVLNKLKMVVSFPTWPLVSPLYTYRYYKKAVELHMMNNYDGILSVYTPIDTLVVGAMLKKRYKNLKLILYFLDCFSGGIAPRHLTKEWLEKRGYKWEKWLFDVADIVFIMQSHKEHYSRQTYRKHFTKITAVDIPLMRKLKYTPNRGGINLSNEMVNIVYAGTMLKHIKNPTYMLEALKLINKSNRYCVHIYGRGDCHDIIAQYIEEGKGIPIIEHGYIDPDMAINAMLQADILVNIGSTVDTQIPSKIFEYMAAGKPIISFYKHDTEPSIRYLQKYPHALLIKENWTKLDNNAQLIVTFIDEHKGKVAKYSEIANAFQDNTPDMLVRYVLEIVH